MLFFCLFQYFEEKEYQTESKRNETFGSVIFGTNMIQRAWSASQEVAEAATRVPGMPPTLVGPSSVNRHTSSSYIYLRTPNYQIRSQNPNSTAVTFCIHEIPSWGLFQSSAGGGIDQGRLLHQHHSLSDEV